ncbi:UNVERIFIED_CONTAM: hypothetical protein Scaly_2924800 [Sesamum calycinum]|uniref:Transposase n=1 Tax=Sesamum calycinum TaxID=2727403 RepID=A0AAW2KU93_9LAMI
MQDYFEAVIAPPVSEERTPVGHVEGVSDDGTRSCSVDAGPSSYCYGGSPYEIVLPDHTLLGDYYNMKKLVKDLSLPVEKIDACKNSCMLYWKDEIDLEYCKFYGDARYKPYLGETHTEKSPSEGSICHRSDAEVWKYFDLMYPDFAEESHNVRLGLYIDSFAPHGQYNRTYSYYPVIITPYNLSLGMCMSFEYMFLTMVIPGPSNSKRLIGVYLEPLIEELLQLWHVGVRTYDHATNNVFIMRAALMWTVNELPTYGMASGKAYYFDCHRQSLPEHHSYRRNKKAFMKNRVENKVIRLRLTGYQILDRVVNISPAVEMPLSLPDSYVMDIKKKTKDNMNGRRDLKIICNRLELELDERKSNVMPKVVYTLAKEQKRRVLMDL